MPLLSKRLHIGLDWLLDAFVDAEIVELPIARSEDDSH